MYKLSVSRTGIEKRKRIGRLLHLAAGLLLILFLGTHYKELSGARLYLLLPALWVALVSLAYFFLQMRFDPHHSWNSGLRLMQALSFCSVALLVTAHAKTVLLANLYVLAAVCIYLLFTEQQLDRNSHLMVSDRGVLVPQTVGGRNLEWMYISDIVFRADYVTVFLNNEKFLQVELSQHYTTEELKEIERFSKEKILAARNLETSLN